MTELRATRPDEDAMTALLLPELRNLARSTSQNIKWHVITSIAFAGSNAPEEVAHVLRFALKHDAVNVQDETAQRIARETREGLIKAGQLMYVIYVRPSQLTKQWISQST